MACYQCNEEEGDEIHLCSKCNAERQEKLKNPFPPAEELPPEPLITPSRVLTCAGLVGAICVSMFMVCYAPFGPGYGLSKGEQAFRRCGNKVTEAVAESEKKKLKDPKAGLSILALAKMNAECEALREKCNLYPETKTCQAILS